MQDNRVFCFKMALRLDNTISRSPEINKIKQLRIDYVDNTKKLGAEENTIHENTINKNTTQGEVIHILKPLLQEKEFCVTEEYFSTLLKAHPRADITAELNKMNAWLESNPAKRKTVSGAKRFINSWLDRADDNKMQQKNTVDILQQQALKKACIPPEFHNEVLEVWNKNPGFWSEKMLKDIKPDCIYQMDVKLGKRIRDARG